MRVRNIFNIVYIREAVKNIQLLSMWQAYTHCDNLYIVDKSEFWRRNNLGKFR